MTDQPTTTVHISIGNSDDKLSQSEWAHFYAEVNAAIDRHASAVHGRWASDPTSPWQNACWCIEPFDADHEAALKEQLALAASAFRQDSIAWTPGVTEFIAPPADPTPAPTA